MHQAIFAAKIEPLDAFSDYEVFRSLRHKLAWIGHIRPDIVEPVIIIKQVTAGKFDGTHVKTINAIVRLEKANSDRVFTQHKLDEGRLRLVVFAYS